jgi:hypothetical protein
MTSQPLEETVWATATAARLRMVQASFADDDAARREGFLAEEIDGALKEIPSSRKRSHLRALLARFPAAAEEQPAPAANSAPSPEAQVAEFIDRLPDLAPDLQAMLTDKLSEAGFLPSAAQPGALNAGLLPAELRKKFPVQPDQNLDPVRTLKLLAVLLDFVFSVDQLVWSLWKNLAPNSVVRRDVKTTADYRQSVANYLAGDSEVSTAQVSQIADKTRQLTAALVAGIGSTGETFARTYLARFSPIMIKQAADAEPGLLANPDRKCWRKYVELFDQISGAKIENEIANAIAQYAEQLILGTKPKPD